MQDVNIYIYTEYKGSFARGSGKWHALLECEAAISGKIETVTMKEIGAEEDITKNRLEVLALLKALQHLTKPCNLTIYTASAYITSAYDHGWLQNWIGHDFKIKGKEIRHADLWKQVVDISVDSSIRVKQVGKTSYTAAQRSELEHWKE
jgi:ribonuclease HI